MNITREQYDQMQKKVDSKRDKSNHIPVGGFSKKGRPDLEKEQKKLHDSHLMETKTSKTVIHNSKEYIMLPIKPLSVNMGYTGKRYKTNAHRTWKNKVLELLPNITIHKADKYQIEFIFGLSNNASDYDNFIKFSQDLIASKYKFNDKKIRRAIIDVEIIKKGMEFIKFRVTELA